MKKFILICFILCLVSSAMAQIPVDKVLHTYDWQDLMAQHPFPNSEIVSMDGMSVLKIEKTNSAPLEITFLTITNSALVKKVEFISFDIKYENVQDKLVSVTNRFGTHSVFIENVSGNLILSSVYPPDAQGGDLNTNASYYDITGTSNWKPQFFNVSPLSRADGSESLPIWLALKLNLPATGTVYLRPVKLMGHTQRGFSPQLGVVVGVAGGIGGAGIGCFGALIGCLVGMGKARRFVLAMTKIFIGLGILLMMAGIVAAACHQPWPVWYSMLLAGFVLTIVFSVNLYPIKRRYDKLEIRRMTSMDAAGG